MLYGPHGQHPWREDMFKRPDKIQKDLRVFDWLVDGDIHNPADMRVGDGNCRGPGLPICASGARKAFEDALVSSAKKIV
jgi:hypothetical protein